ncbi:MAG: tetratricopeptide repeat protein [Bacteroidaceae bacterium]|nr:tetratricopeptide repeat protein [Bacteroidaceae bacterium]
MINIKELIEDRSKLNAETLLQLKDLVEAYPFFQAARILYVANLYALRSPAFGSELRKASVFVPDRQALFTMTEGGTYELPNESLPKASIETESDSNRTISLIDSYLESEADHSKPSIAELTTDYAQFLVLQDKGKAAKSQSEEEEPKLKGGDLIDTFLKQTDGKQRFEFPEVSDEDFVSPVISDEDEEIYTESMVNIYIKQRRYQQALEIIHKICLNNPKKNSTFAAQISLLEVIIQGNKQ